MRLWVFVSVIWAIAVIVVTALMVADEGDITVHESTVVSQLSPESKVYFNHDGDEAQYVISLVYDNGHIVNINFKHSDAIPDIDELSEALSLAEVGGGKVSREKVETFRQGALETQVHAKKAQEEFDTHALAIKKRKLGKRNDILLMGVGFLVIPSLILLAFGYGVAWVRQGFVS